MNTLRVVKLYNFFNSGVKHVIPCPRGVANTLSHTFNFASFEFYFSTKIWSTLLDCVDPFDLFIGRKLSPGAYKYIPSVEEEEAGQDEL